jgi:hypothetical protein
MRFADPANRLPVVQHPPYFPIDPAALNAFPIRQFLFNARVDPDPDFPVLTPIDFFFSGDITSVRLAVAPTPEPATLLLVGAACAALLHRRTAERAR